MLAIEQLALLVALLAVVVAFYVPRRAATEGAASRFRGAVLRELAGLYPIPANWPDHLEPHLRAVFPQLQAAVAEFRPHLRFWKRRSFDMDWFAYYCATGREVDKNYQVYHHYMDFTSADQPVPNGKEVFRQNVLRLLRYAGEP